MTSPLSLSLRRFPALLAFLVLATLSHAAAGVYVGGTYDNEGTVAQIDSGYNGPVSFRGLLALDFNLAAGVAKNTTVKSIDIIQEEWKFAIRALKEDGTEAWSADWARDGGFESTKDGLKFLMRRQRKDGDIYMFTLVPMNDGAILTVKIDKIEHSTFGATGINCGTFVFLKAKP